MERRTAFMKQRSSELRHGPNRFQLSSIQNINEENGRPSYFVLFLNVFSVWLAMWCLKISTFVLIKVLLKKKLLEDVQRAPLN